MASLPVVSADVGADVISAGDVADVCAVVATDVICSDVATDVVCSDVATEVVGSDVVWSASVLPTSERVDTCEVSRPVVDTVVISDSVLDAVEVGASVVELSWKIVDVNMVLEITSVVEDSSEVEAWDDVVDAALADTIKDT